MKKETASPKKSWFTKNWSNVLFFIVVILFLIPSTRFQLQVLINRAFSFSPSVENEQNLKQLSNYDWQLLSKNEKPVNFKISEGKIILVNFWASWCGPCVAEMPSLQELYNTHKDDVDFYFVAKDEKEAIRQFMNKEKYDFPVYFEQQNSPDILQSKQLPTTYLIDKQGYIWVEKTGAANWNSEKINQLIKKLLAE